MLCIGMSHFFAILRFPQYVANICRVPGTFPIGNDAFGRITGFYVDASGVAHGFIRILNDAEAAGNR
jgi:hypothetical protein